MEQVLKQQGTEILLGNEAIVRGALEAGLQFSAAYPGTPSSEIGNVLSKVAKKAGMYFEFSTNEKTALEAVIGASFSGLKCLAAMKNFGVNVASDALFPFLYTGSKGPTVLAVADDPSCHSSAQSEENSRGFSYLAHIPTLEPSDPQECKDFTKLGFEISEKFGLPIMIRETTRVAHQSAPVKLEPLPQVEAEPLSGKFVKDKHKFVTMPPRVMEQHQELLDKITKLKEFSEKSEINRIENKDAKSKLGIIASGVSYLYIMEALQELGELVPVLKLGFFYPLPEKKIAGFIKDLDRVLIAEELEPFLEREVLRIAKTANPKLEVLGKNVLSEIGELTPDQVIQAVSALLGKKSAKSKPLPFKKIKHLPRFCTAPACPYWKLFAAVKQAVDEKEVVFGGDIGCYMIAALKPHNLYDYVSCMGSSLGIAHGVAKAFGNKQKVIAFMGDGTFFHAGIPALINAVYNKSNPLLIVSDNRITAMTGHQPNPGSGRTAMGEPAEQIKIEEVARALNVKHIAVIDPEQEFEKLVSTIKEFSAKDEVSVIVSRRVCALLANHQQKNKKDETTK